MTPTTDQREKALDDIIKKMDSALHLSWTAGHGKHIGATADIYHYCLEDAKKALSELQDIKSALTAPPQVPQEVVDALRDLRGCCNLPRENQYKRQCMVKADEALALLTQGRE